MNTVFAIASIVIKELYRRKDFYVLFILTAIITLMVGSINFLEQGGIVGILKEISLLLVWISGLVIAVTTTARQIPAEKESRTIFPLLAKPVSRGQLLLGKFFGCWFACGLSLVVFYLFFCTVVSVQEKEWQFAAYAQALWLQWVFLGIVVAMALAGSLVFAAPSSNSTICFVIITGLMFLGQHLGKIALRLPDPSRTILYTVYFLVPHAEFFDVRDLVTHKLGLVAFLPTLLVTLYGFAYIGFFLTLAWILFRRKNLA